MGCPADLNLGILGNEARRHVSTSKTGIPGFKTWSTCHFHICINYIGMGWGSLSKALERPLGYVKLCRYKGILTNADVDSLTLFSFPEENTCITVRLKANIVFQIQLC